MNADCLEQPGESQRLCDLVNAPMIGCGRHRPRDFLS